MTDVNNKNFFYNRSKSSTMPPWVSFAKLAGSITLLLALAFAIISTKTSRTAPSLRFVSTTTTSTIPYFPDVEIVMDMAILSNAVYHLRKKVNSCHDAQARNRTLIINLLQEEGTRNSNNNQTTDAQDIYQLLLPEGTECLHYSHDVSLGTQVLIVRSTLHKYVAVCYAGTDDWHTALTDGDILTSDFGPLQDDSNNNTASSNNIFEGVPDGVRVHKGFNGNVFANDGFNKILKCVSSARLGGDCDDEVSGRSAGGDVNHMDTSLEEPYQLFTTGHSLGAASSVLLGAALHLAYPNETLRSINFGCPKIGNIRWSFWMDSLQPDKKEGSGDHSTSSSSSSFEIFRFVNKIDLVPRLPELPMLTHAGHTLQMSVGGTVRVRIQFFSHIFYVLKMNDQAELL